MTLISLLKVQVPEWQKVGHKDLVLSYVKSETNANWLNYVGAVYLLDILYDTQ